MRVLSILVNGIRTEIMEFENLKEFIKPSTSHYILKYKIGRGKAIYYTIADGANFALLAFCIDKNYNSEGIKMEGDKIFEVNEPTGTSIAIAKVREDTFLVDTMNAYNKACSKGAK